MCKHGLSTNRWDSYGHKLFSTHSGFVFIFSAPEPKYTIVITHGPSSVRRPSLTFHIFDFFSETAERNSTKLDRKQDLNVLYQVCVFTGRLETQSGRSGLWLAETLSTSTLKLLNGIQRNLTASNISTPSTKLMFCGPIGKKRWPPGLWFADTFSTSPLKPLNGIQRNLTGIKISMSST